jgi:hypothetical protein
MISDKQSGVRVVKEHRIMRKSVSRSKRLMHLFLILSGGISYITHLEVLHISAAVEVLASIGDQQRSPIPQTNTQAMVEPPLTAGDSLSGAVIYDQISGACSNSTTSQKFEPGLADFNTELADDFVVPIGQSWTIQQVNVLGVYANGFGPVSSFNIVFYANSGGLPGAVECSLLNQPFTKAATLFSIPLTIPCILSPGAHWVSVQANGRLANGQWFWTDRAPQSNNGAVFRNPGGRLAPSCTSFGRRTSCLAIDPDCPDQAFQLFGAIEHLFDICLQDDSSNNVLQINTTTGEYQFTNCAGLTIGGTGTLTKRGNQITLQHNASDRRVLASIDSSTKRATASVQLLSTGRTFGITDRNITNNTCACR